MASFVDTHTSFGTRRPIQVIYKPRQPFQEAVASGDLIYIPPICLVECIYLVEKGRIPVPGFEAILSALASRTSALKLAAFDLPVADAVFEFHERRCPSCRIA